MYVIFMLSQIMTTCFDVFATWDDEYDKLQGLLRDIVKKMRHDQLKMVWRLNPAHKKIQTRLEQMRKLVSRPTHL